MLFFLYNETYKEIVVLIRLSYFSNLQYFLYIQLKFENTLAVRILYNNVVLSMKDP